MDWIAVILAAITALGIPTAATSFAIRRFEKRLDTREDAKRKEAEDREAERRKEEAAVEAARKKSMVLVVKGVGAAIALGEATARAVQRIPDAHCNGDMKEALEYAQSVKHEQKDFLTEQASESLFS